MSDPKTLLADGLTHLIENWKSTVANLLTLVITAGAFFSAIPNQVLQQNGITQKEIFWGTCVVGLAKLFVGLVQKDAK